MVMDIAKNKWTMLGQETLDPYPATWSPDSHFVAAIDESGDNINIIRMKDKKVMASFATQAQVYSMAWSPNGKYLGSGSADGSVKIWDAKNGGAALVTLVPNDASQEDVQGIAWSPDNAAIAASFGDGRVWIWQFAQG